MPTKKTARKTAAKTVAIGEFPKITISTKDKIAGIIEEIEKRPKSRENDIALTNLRKAIVWLERA